MYDVELMNYKLNGSETREYILKCPRIKLQKWYYCLNLLHCQLTMYTCRHTVYAMFTCMQFFNYLIKASIQGPYSGEVEQ